MKDRFSARLIDGVPFVDYGDGRPAWRLQPLPDVIVKFSKAIPYSVAAGTHMDDVFVIVDREGASWFYTANDRTLTLRGDPPKQDDPRDKGPVHSVRLRAIVPGQKAPASTSWFGGRPEMPADVAWPQFNGQPCVFIAQIDCTELPEKIWGGRGPRKGWLLFFWSAQYRRAVPTLYIRERGAVRQPPAGRIILEGCTVTGRPELDPPRISVEVLSVVEKKGFQEIDAGREPGKDPNNPNPHKNEQIDLNNKRYQPFDWVSLQALTDRAAEAAETASQSTAIFWLNYSPSRPRRPKPNLPA